MREEGKQSREDQQAKTEPLETARLTATQIPMNYNKGGEGLGPPQILESDIVQVTRVVFPPKRIKRKKK